MCFFFFCCTETFSHLCLTWGPHIWTSHSGLYSTVKINDFFNLSCAMITLCNHDLLCDFAVINHLYVQNVLLDWMLHKQKCNNISYVEDVLEKFGTFLFISQFFSFLVPGLLLRSSYAVNVWEPWWWSRCPQLPTPMVCLWAPLNDKKIYIIKYLSVLINEYANVKIPLASDKSIC